MFYDLNHTIRDLLGFTVFIQNFLVVVCGILWCGQATQFVEGLLGRYPLAYHQ